MLPGNESPLEYATDVDVDSVLFVNVSVVALPTKVSVEVGRVSVPVFEIVLITGEVSVLFVRFCISEVPTIVPDGSVYPNT